MCGVSFLLYPEYKRRRSAPKKESNRYKPTVNTPTTPDQQTAKHIQRPPPSPAGEATDGAAPALTALCRIPPPHPQRLTTCTGGTNVFCNTSSLPYTAEELTGESMRSIAVLQGPFPPPPPPSEASATVVGGGVQTSSPLTAPEYLASASPGEDTTGSSVAFVTPGLVLFFAAAASLAAAAVAAKSRRRARRMVRGFLAPATALRRTADSSIMLSRVCT